MKKKKKDGEYLTPKIKVIEIKSQGVLCMSGDPLQSYPGWEW